MKNRVSAKASSFTESVIRDMSRQALAHGAVNLSQGFPDFPAPEDIKRAACEAINADVKGVECFTGSDGEYLSYDDDNGTANIVESPAQVPARYRSTARCIHLKPQR